MLHPQGILVDFICFYHRMRFSLDEKASTSGRSRSVGGKERRCGLFGIYQGRNYSGRRSRTWVPITEHTEERHSLVANSFKSFSIPPSPFTSIHSVSKLFKVFQTRASDSMRQRETARTELCRHDPYPCMATNRSSPMKYHHRLSRSWLSPSNHSSPNLSLRFPGRVSRRSHVQ